MGSFAGRVFLVLLLSVAVVPGIADRPLDAQETCDPSIDPACSDPYGSSYCDPYYDANCGPGTTDPTYDPTYDPNYCDPYYDTTCDPYDDPTYDPNYCDSTCDPYDDPTYDPNYCDPYYDTTCDPYYDSTYDPNYCDPYYDTTCDPYYDSTYDPNYCDPYYDAGCSPEPGPTPSTVPSAVAFKERSQSVKSVVSRADTSDDIVVSSIPIAEVAEVAASRLVLGLDALAELGAFRRSADPTSNDLVRQVRDQVPPDGLTEDGYRSEIARLAEDLPQFVSQLEASGLEVSAELLEVSNLLDEETLDAILAGETSVIDPQTWIAALADLSIRGGSAPIDPSERDDDGTAVLGVALLFVPETVDEEPAVVEETPPTTVEATTTTSSAPATTAPRALALSSEVADPQEGEGLPALLIGAAIAVLLGFVAFLLIRNRASNQSTSEAVAAATESSKLSVSDLLDASRRMTAALDAVEISKIALAEATRLVKSEGGLVAVRSDDQLSTVHHEPHSLFVVDALEDSSLRRVTETGRSVSTVAMDEPVLVEVPMAMAAVPIVADGTITGAIMVVRLASEPFARHELEALEMLAPLVGSAFQAAEAHGSATALADVEPMTGLKNRRRLDRDLAATGDDLVAYIMLDVDHFKNFNDVNGHAAGDEALRRVASTLAASVRPGDVVYRYGGEEFCVLLPATTNAEAHDVAERIRSGIEACEIPGEENQPTGTVTVSIGVADTSKSTVADLVERADAALYEAKHAGRNQVVVDLTEN